MGGVHVPVVLTPSDRRQIVRDSARSARTSGGCQVRRAETMSRLADSSEDTASEAGRAPRPRLMIVDDDPEVRVIVAEFLEDFGYRVLQADGGAQALDLLAKTPDLRMIISDIRMPDMTGIELVDIATQRQHDLKIILISGYFIAQQVEWRFLRKPFRMKELEAAVRAELNE